MFTLNGLNADSPALGWFLTDKATTIAGTTITLPELTIPGMDGGVEMDGVEDVPLLNFEWSIDESNLGGLRNILHSPTLTLGRDGATATAKLKSFTPTQEGVGSDPAYRVTASLTVPSVWLRGAQEDATTIITTDTQTVSALPGTDGKIHDGLVLLHGPFAAGVRVQDVAGGSWFRSTLPVPAGHVLRYDMATARAFLVTSGDGFSGGTEVTSTVETGPAIYRLRLVPAVSTSNPANAQPKLRITSSGRSDTSALTLRARPAYRI